MNETCAPVWLSENRFLWCVDIPAAEWLHIEVFDFDNFSGADKIAESRVRVQDLVDGIGSNDPYSPYQRRKARSLLEDIERHRIERLAKRAMRKIERGLDEEEALRRESFALDSPNRLPSCRMSEFLGSEASTSPGGDVDGAAHLRGRSASSSLRGGGGPPRVGFAEVVSAKSSAFPQKTASFGGSSSRASSHGGEYGDAFSDEDDILFSDALESAEVIERPPEVADLLQKLQFAEERERMKNNEVERLRELRLETIVVDADGEEKSEEALLKKKGMLSNLDPNKGRTLLSPKERWQRGRDLIMRSRCHDARLHLRVRWQPLALTDVVERSIPPERRERQKSKERRAAEIASAFSTPRREDVRKAKSENDF